MGTDSLGSDVFSRVVYGSRISIESALISVGLALLIGVPVGLISGYFRGFWDEWLVMRIVDSIQAFPFLILALVIAAILGGGLGFAMIAIGIGFTPAFVRITRAQVLTVRSLDYVEAARAIGAGNIRIMLQHVLPNLNAPADERRLLLKPALDVSRGLNLYPRSFIEQIEGVPGTADTAHDPQGGAHHELHEHPARRVEQDVRIGPRPEVSDGCAV